MNLLLRVFDKMARMGLAFRSDPISVIDTEGREFGTIACGFDPGTYQVSVSCQLPGGTLTSNQINSLACEPSSRLKPSS